CGRGARAGRKSASTSPRARRALQEWREGERDEARRLKRNQFEVLWLVLRPRPPSIGSTHLRAAPTRRRHLPPRRST
ncbi:MAG TPA: hypothetical protein VM694_10995, partial [Polyangium sp.]|nr:hypothetical protein [Polyangium sp.]